jgi:hypothetical protein
MKWYLYDLDVVFQRKPTVRGTWVGGTWFLGFKKSQRIAIYYTYRVGGGCGKSTNLGMVPIFSFFQIAA